MKYKPKWYDNEQVLRLMYFEQGLNIPEIAIRAGVSAETIRKMLLKYDITKGRK